MIAYLSRTPDIWLSLAKARSIIISVSEPNPPRVPSSFLQQTKIYIGQFLTKQIYANRLSIITVGKLSWLDAAAIKYLWMEIKNLKIYASSIKSIVLLYRMFSRNVLAGLNIARRILDYIAILRKVCLSFKGLWKKYQGVS